MSPKNDPALSRGRVIVTYGRSLMALAIAKSLHDRGVEVIGCDDVDLTVLKFSRNVSNYFIHPKRKENPDAFLDVMVEKAKEHKPDDGRPYMLMPAFDGMRFFAQHRERFEGVIDIAAPDYAHIDRVDPKPNLARTAKALGLRTPQTVEINGLETLEQAAADISFPVMLKAPDGVGGRGVTRAENLKQLLTQFKALETGKALLQEYVAGDDYCHTAIFEHGSLKASMAYKNIRQWPRKSGAGVMRETVDDAPFRDVTEKLLGPLGWNGVAEIDYRWSGEAGEPVYLIEVNPRFWAGLFHSIASGVDFPWALYELTASGSISTDFEAHIGELTRVPGVALLSAVSDIAASESHFDKLKTGWRRGLGKIGEGRVIEGVRIFARNLGDVVDRDDAAFQLMEALYNTRKSESEISLKEDALSNLGFLYVLSSLLRHGELPPEMKH